MEAQRLARLPTVRRRGLCGLFVWVEFNVFLLFLGDLLRAVELQNRIDPGDPLDKNLYELPPEELAKVPSVPDSLAGALEALEADHEFLLKGDVFNKDFINNWIEMKNKEYDALRLRTHPYEFYMYFDL